MNFYPHINPIILTDEIFVAYGGETGTATSAQRESAYLLAEQRVTDTLRAFLLPTLITGTYTYFPIQAIVTDYAYVHTIESVTLISREGDSSCTFVSKNTCAYIRDDSFGIVDPHYLQGCGCSLPWTPYQVKIAYTSGLATGVANQPNILQALTIMADISLNEMLPQHRANEGVGDIGIHTFSTQGYREERTKLFNTPLGNSPRALYAVKLLSPYRKRRYAGL